MPGSRPRHAVTAVSVDLLLEDPRQKLAATTEASIGQFGHYRTRPSMHRLTYAQLGNKLGISAEAARTLARRRGWEKQMPNHRGSPVSVLVPDEALESERWRELDRADPDNSEQAHDHLADMAEQRAVEAEQRAIEAGRRADEATRLADTALALVDRLGTQLADAGDRANRLERDLSAALTAAEQARGDAAQARAEAREAKERAEEDRRAEEGRADKAEAAVDIERSRADALLKRLEGAERDLAAAQRDAETAQQAAAELRQADEVRKARGFWKRLQDALRNSPDG